MRESAGASRSGCRILVTAAARRSWGATQAAGRSLPTPSTDHRRPGPGGPWWGRQEGLCCFSWPLARRRPGCREISEGARVQARTSCRMPLTNRGECKASGAVRGRLSGGRSAGDSWEGRRSRRGTPTPSAFLVRTTCSPSSSPDRLTIDKMFSYSLGSRFLASIRRPVMRFVLPCCVVAGLSVLAGLSRGEEATADSAEVKETRRG